VKKFLLLVAFTISCFFVYSLNANASSYSKYEPTVEFQNSILTTQNFFLSNNATNEIFEFYSNYPFDDIQSTPGYALIGICTTGTINNISTDSEFVENLQLYKTEQTCKLNNVFDYKGKITYITYSIDSYKTSCNVSLQNCIAHANIYAYFSFGGYVQLYNAYFSDDAFIYDSSLDSVITSNKEISDKINSTNEKLDSVKQEQEKTNEELGELNDSIKDESSPNTSSLENSAGWLPPGPVDSILNLPLAFFNNLTVNLSKSCNPVILPLPYIDKTLELPCISTIYEQIGVQDLLNWIGVIVSGLILFSYFKHLYQWVDNTLSMRENTWNDTDQWGGL